MCVRWVGTLVGDGRKAGSLARSELSLSMMLDKRMDTEATTINKQANETNRERKKGQNGNHAEAKQSKVDKGYTTNQNKSISYTYQRLYSMMSL